MPIEVDEHGGMMITGAGIPLYALLALKHAVQFEDEHKGFQMCRGRSATAIAKDRLGMKRSTPRSVIIAELDRLLETQLLFLKAEKEAGL